MKTLLKNQLLQFICLFIFCSGLYVACCPPEEIEAELRDLIYLLDERSQAYAWSSAWEDSMQVYGNAIFDHFVPEEVVSGSSILLKELELSALRQELPFHVKLSLLEPVSLQLTNNFEAVGETEIGVWHDELGAFIPASLHLRYDMSNRLSFALDFPNEIIASDANFPLAATFDLKLNVYKCGDAFPIAIASGFTGLRNCRTAGKTQADLEKDAIETAHKETKKDAEAFCKKQKDCKKVKLIQKDPQANCICENPPGTKLSCAVVDWYKCVE